MDLSFASKAAEAKAQIADALKRLPPAPPPMGPLGAPPQPMPPQGGPQAPAPQGAPPQAPQQPPMSPLAAIGMQRPPMPPQQPQQPPQAPNLAVPRAFAKGGRVRNQTRSLAVQLKGN